MKNKHYNVILPDNDLKHLRLLTEWTTFKRLTEGGVQVPSLNTETHTHTHTVHFKTRSFTVFQICSCIMRKHLLHKTSSGSFDVHTQSQRVFLWDDVSLCCWNGFHLQCCRKQRSHMCKSQTVTFQLLQVPSSEDLKRWTVFISDVSESFCSLLTLSDIWYFVSITTSKMNNNVEWESLL